jgi:hypothetical protein
MAISEFGKAFRAARSAGDKTFMFNGKKYTTEMADDKPRSVGGTPVLDKYVPRDSDARKGEEMTSKNYVPRDSYDRRGETMTAKNYVPRDNYTRSGQESFDTETEPMKKGGKVKKMASGGMTASKRGDGIAQRGKTRGTMVMCGGGMSKGKK